MRAQPGQGHVCGQRLVAHTGEGGSGQLEGETLCQLLNLPSETREDRTKRLFRHYTVGSYDSLSAHRYRRGRWAGGQRGQMGEARGKAVSGAGWCPTRTSAASPASPGTTPRAGAAHGPCLGHVGGQPDPGAFSRVLLTSPFSFISDYVIDDKVAVLQKRDHEGFGFVLRGAKGNDQGGVPLAMRASCLASAPFLPHCPLPSRLPAVTVYSGFGMLVGGSSCVPSLIFGASAEGV